RRRSGPQAGGQEGGATGGGGGRRAGPGWRGRDRRSRPHGRAGETSREGRGQENGPGRDQGGSRPGGGQEGGRSGQEGGRPGQEGVSLPPELLNRMDRRAWWRRGAWVGAVLVLDLAVGAAVGHALVAHPRSVTLDSGHSDTALFVWWLRWAPFSLGHGLNPL